MGEMEAAEENPGGSAIAEGQGPSAAEAKAAALQAALASVVLPAWRKAYLANLIASGRRFASIGNDRGTGYCFSKVDEALRTAASVASDAATEAAARAGSPASAGSAAPERPAERVRRRMRLDRIAHAEQVLESHGARLSALEKKTYRDRLGKLRLESSEAFLTGKADAGLLDLRRRLYHRVLKSQKATLLRKRSPDGGRPPRPARASATPLAWQAVTGPYNDRSNLEELLSVISAADPAWVEEFLELYGDLAGLSALLPSGTAPKK
jgi:hypothetical protein